MKEKVRVQERLLWMNWRTLSSSLDIPWMKWSWILPGTTNLNSIRVFAPRRSGHHAIINWIRYQLPGRHCFLNDCKPGKNPFERGNCTRKKSIVHSWCGDHKFIDWEKELAGKNSKKGTIIHNYEDYDFSDFQENILIERESLWFGDSHRTTAILILRDPFNLLASKLRWAYGQTNAPTLMSLAVDCHTWKVYAKEFLGDTRHVNNLICISYNEWFVSKSYRDDIAKHIGFINQDIGLSEVAKFGPTTCEDSFDKLNFDGQAEKMDVLARWKQYENNLFFKSLFEDRELWDLSGRIFGDIPGTSSLITPKIHELG